MIIGFKVLNRAVWTRFNIRFNEFHQSIILSACLSNRLFVSLLLLLSYTLPLNTFPFTSLSLSLSLVFICPSFSLLASLLVTLPLQTHKIHLHFVSICPQPQSVCLSASLSPHYSPLPFFISYFTTFFSPFLFTLFFP